MAESKMLLALFEDIEPASDGVVTLQQMGLPDGDVNIISGIPIRPSILNRPSAVTRVSTIGFVGSLLGFLLGVFFIWGVPYLFPLVVGGQAIFPWPQLFIIVFEMTMLGLMGFSFIGMFVDSGFPAYNPMHYVPEISDGKIGVLFRVPEDEEGKFVDALKKAGAESVSPAEARQL